MISGAKSIFAARQRYWGGHISKAEFNRIVMLELGKRSWLEIRPKATIEIARPQSNCFGHTRTATHHSQLPALTVARFSLRASTCSRF
jgi:hypothetical protein